MAVGPADLRTLMDYHYWANDRMLGAVAALTAAQYTQDLGNSFASIQATLAHLMNAEAVWLTRMLGTEVPGTKPADIPDVATARARWQSTEAQLRQVVAAAGPDAPPGASDGLDQPVIARYGDTVVTYRRWQVIQQLVNHGAYHRGQIVTMLRQMGAAPVQTDLIYYYRSQMGGA